MWLCSCHLVSCSSLFIVIYRIDMKPINCNYCGCMPKPDEWADEYNCIDCGPTEQ